MQCDLFPADRSADLIVCNPPWLPAKPSSPVEYAVYDYQSQMLRGFLAGAKAHLNANGEVWLVMSNLAELLLLRPADALPAWIAQSGFKLVQKLDAQAQHAKAADASDMLYEARRREVTSLYRLKVI
jgi:methylase of polypeptide subunit release factors